MTRVIAQLLSGCLLLAGCPHDFDRARQDVGSPDMAFDVARPDLPAPAEDAPAPDAWVQLDTVPTPDAGCPLPCVTTLTGSFTSVGGIAVGNGGKLYIAETGANRIWIHTNGTTDFLAGDLTSGFFDGVGAAARFHSPMGMALAPAGVVYVADESNNSIRMISTGATVGTLAGDGKAGLYDGAASEAHFWGPADVAVDGNGTAYVADYANNCIRSIAGGQVYTFAGDGWPAYENGPAKTASFNNPGGVAVDSAGAVYVGDSSNHRVRVIKAGYVDTLAGDGANTYVDGPAAYASFSGPTGVAVDSAGTVYVADSGNNRIRVIKNGLVDTLAGDGTPTLNNGTGTTASFKYPHGLALDSSETMLYVADTNNNKIRVIQLK